MAKRGTTKRNRDGISVEDRWSALGHRRGVRWIFKVRDPILHTYIKENFTDEDAGWTWAKDTQAKVLLGQDSAAKALTAVVAKEYVQGLTDPQAPRSSRQGGPARDGLVGGLGSDRSQGQRLSGQGGALAADAESEQEG